MKGKKCFQVQMFHNQHYERDYYLIISIHLNRNIPWQIPEQPHLSGTGRWVPASGSEPAERSWGRAGLLLGRAKPIYTLPWFYSKNTFTAVTNQEYKECLSRPTITMDPITYRDNCISHTYSHPCCVFLLKRKAIVSPVQDYNRVLLCSIREC